jgi:hypothetical protein
LKELDEAIHLLKYISSHPNGWEWSKLIDKEIIKRLEVIKKCKVEL